VEPNLPLIFHLWKRWSQIYRLFSTFRKGGAKFTAYILKKCNLKSLQFGSTFSKG